MFCGIVESEVDRFYEFAVCCGDVRAVDLVIAFRTFEEFVAVVESVVVFFDDFDEFARRACGCRFVFIEFDIDRFGKREVVGYCAEVFDEAISCGERFHNARGVLVDFDNFVDFELVNDTAEIVEGCVLFGERLHKHAVCFFDADEFVKEHIVELCADLVESVASACHLLKCKSGRAFLREIISCVSCIGVGIVKTISWHFDIDIFAGCTACRISEAAVCAFFETRSGFIVCILVVGNEYLFCNIRAVCVFDVGVELDIHDFTDGERVRNGVEIVESATSLCERFHYGCGCVVDFDEFVDFEVVDFSADFGKFAIFQRFDCHCRAFFVGVDDVADSERIEQTVCILKFDDAHIGYDLKQGCGRAFVYAQERLSAACVFTLVESAEHAVLGQGFVHNIVNVAVLVRAVFEFVASIVDYDFRTRNRGSGFDEII